MTFEWTEMRNGRPQTRVFLLRRSYEEALGAPELLGRVLRVARN
jgi:hypothetical protein